MYSFIESREKTGPTLGLLILEAARDAPAPGPADTGWTPTQGEEDEEDGEQISICFPARQEHRHGKPRWRQSL